MRSSATVQVTLLLLARLGNTHAYLPTHRTRGRLDLSDGTRLYALFPFFFFRPFFSDLLLEHHLSCWHLHYTCSLGAFVLIPIWLDASLLVYFLVRQEQGVRGMRWHRSVRRYDCMLGTMTTQRMWFFLVIFMLEALGVGI